VGTISCVKLKIAWVGKTRDPAIQSLTSDFLKRLRYYADVEGMILPSEATLLKMRERAGGRPAHSIILLDARGKQLSSEELAKFLEDHQNRNPQPLLFAVGGADGFSETALQAASFVLSLGKMTLSHEIARVVLLEQLYRAFSILRGHPYHLAH
jgi:23S rRNA (pseudouridine1915-N3)-methyltransferase